MKANTAFAFLVSGLGLLLLSRENVKRTQHGIGLGCALLTTLIGATALIEYRLNLDLGVDNLLFADQREPTGISPPGRMSQATAFNFLLNGVALVLFACRQRNWMLEIPTITALAVALLALAGYMYDASSLYRVGAFGSVAIHTAIGFVLLGFAILAANPNHGLLGIVTRDSAGGVICRRLLPFAIVVPLIVSWLQLVGTRRGLYESGFGAAIFGLLAAMVLVGVVLWCASSLNKTDSKRLRAEQDLEKERMLLRTTIDAMPDMVFVKDLHGRFGISNRAHLELLGVANDTDIIGKTVFDVHPQHLAQAYHDDDLRVLRQGETINNREEIARDTSGRDLWHLVIKTPLRDAGGKITGLVGISRNIQDRKRTEEILRYNEAQFRAAFENTNVAMVLTDMNNRFTRVNAAFAEMFGYSQTELLCLSMADITHPDDLAESIRRRADLLSGQSHSFEMEIRYLHKDGQLIWGVTNVAIVRDSGGRPMLYVGQVQDITERKRAQQRLQVAHGVVAILATASNLGEVAPRILSVVCETLGWDVGDFWRLDRRGNVLVCVDVWPPVSPKAGEFIDQSRATQFKRGEGLPGRVWASGEANWIVDVTKDKNFPRAAAAAKQGLRGGFGFPILAGSEFFGVVEFFSRESREPDEQLLLMFKTLASQIGQFIERDLLQEQFRQAQKMEAVGRLAGGVAHDFNNLLTVINGYSEIVIAGLDRDDPTRAMIEEVKLAGERAALLTRQLLAFSRKQVLQPTLLDLNSLVANMETMLRRLIGEDIDFQLRTTLNLWRNRADVGQLEQVVMNLCVNARDAMPKGGKLTIETANVTLEESYVANHSEAHTGEFVLLAVSDTGCGIDEATKARIFEPFFTTKGPEKGTGLGLATVFGIVKQSGGHIEVYSEVGMGTTFKVYLPRDLDGKQNVEKQTENKTMSQGTETLLLAEDEDNVRSFARIVLQNCGFTVLEAKDGAEALSICERKENKFQLLVTDVVMPNLSGREVADRIVAIRPEIKVLFLSGYTDDAIVHHGVLEAGTPFLQKPFTPAALAKKVREVLDSVI
jgi:PAS domain S-box-containing protein